MKNSIYATAAGLLTSAERLNVVANNTANFSTNGFKADIPFEQTLRFLEEGPYPGKDQPVLGGIAHDLSQGLFKHTQRPLDIAVEGEGFFAIEGPGKQPVYTRNGAFNLNSKRELVTAEGYKVLDKYNKEITLIGEKFHITPRGEIFTDDNYYTSLKIVDSPNRDDVEKVGDTFFRMKEGVKEPDVIEAPSLLTGALEKSNVNLLKNIATMMQLERAFEMQKTAADVILKLVRKAATEIAKPV